MADNTDQVLGGLATILQRARPSWMSSAACRGTTVAVFLPSKPTGASRAFDVCGRCEVRAACLEWALGIGDYTAILGGTDGPARRRIAAQRAKETT